MSSSKISKKLFSIVLVLAVVFSAAFSGLQLSEVKAGADESDYVSGLFDKSKVHTIDIVMNDWDGFLKTCESEEYSACSITIDGITTENVGIRGKGNTSLSQVRSMNSSRYSFKIEFDHYDDDKSYYGLDKLCLNNIIQDNTYMKDYITYTLMDSFGVDAPLCSFAYITVNGEDWGLYLAVEAVEDSFLERNYGSEYGDLYKPDNTGFGGGRGNGRNFNMSDFWDRFNSEDGSSETDEGEMPNWGRGRMPGFGGGQMPDPGEGSVPDFGEGGIPDFGEGWTPDFGTGEIPAFGEGGMPDFGNGQMPDFGEGWTPDFGTGEMPDFGEGGMPDFGTGETPDFGEGEMPNFGNGQMPNFGQGGFGMGSEDVKLKYIDDEIESYSSIFDNAKTKVNKEDKNRLISSLKALSEQSDLENTVNIDEVIRYFVVHNYVCNGDSYTGQMIHNYYLYEEDGQLSMIPWDYNLAFGTFRSTDATSSVNSPIDSPVTGDISDRPMIAWIFDNEQYLEQYHTLFGDFITNTDIVGLINETAEMISDYVEKDPTKFCTFEEFKEGAKALAKFCELRNLSILGQLDGSVPSTSQGQTEDKSSLIDASELDMSKLGSTGMGMGGMGRNRNRNAESSERRLPSAQDRNTNRSSDDNRASDRTGSSEATQTPDGEDSMGNDRSTEKNGLLGNDKSPDENGLPGNDQIPDENRLPGNDKSPDKNGLPGNDQSTGKGELTDNDKNTNAGDTETYPSDNADIDITEIETPASDEITENITQEESSVPFALTAIASILVFAAGSVVYYKLKKQ